jgi:hypothetical protein
MDAALEMKFIDCLDALEAGESIDQILARYPKEAEQLRPMLETAAQLAQLRLQPSLAAQSKARALFLAQAEQLRSVSPSPRSTLARWRQRLLPLLSLALFLLVLGVGLVTFSAPAIPGDPLYGAKRLTEGVRLALTAGLSARLALGETFNRERIREVQTLLAEGREAQVEFAGLLEAKDDDIWLIAGLPVLVNESTEIRGPAQVGQLATVIGYTSGGSLTAVTITTPGEENFVATPTIGPESAATVEATTLPMATATTTPTHEPTVTASLTPSATNMATATPRPTIGTFTATATTGSTLQPTATSTVPAPATATPPVEDNGNDNDNDNETDNSNDNSNENDDNSNDNSNDNGNDNQNDNGNDNENDNDGGNSNDNSNENGNDNQNDNGNNNEDDNENDNNSGEG